MAAPFHKKKSCLLVDDEGAGILGGLYFPGTTFYIVMGMWVWYTSDETLVGDVVVLNVWDPDWNIVEKRANWHWGMAPRLV